jgi:hypothetical protein
MQRAHIHTETPFLLQKESGVFYFAGPENEYRRGVRAARVIEEQRLVDRLHIVRLKSHVP